MTERTKAIFEIELAELINHHSIENGSDTPDFLLAQYLAGCLDIWNRHIRARENWYGRGSEVREGPNRPGTIAP